MGTNGFSDKVAVLPTQSGEIMIPFGPLMYRTHLPDSVIDRFLEEGERTPMLETDFNFKLFSKEFIKEMEPVILGPTAEFIEAAARNFDMPIPTPDTLSVKSMWANYQVQYETVASHRHFFFLQFVIYCDVPDRILEPIGKHNPLLPGRVEFSYGEEITPLSRQSLLVTPERGLMLIFPGKMNHQVYPFFHDDVRISVAGSIETSHTY